MEYFTITLIVLLMVSCLFLWKLSSDNTYTKTKFLLADRKLGFYESSFSIAASWIWAPALFISAQQAYLHGWVGLFWFCVPNFLCLILFAFLVNRIIEKFPQGYSLSEFMGETYSTRVQILYWISLIGVSIGAFATQVVAGAKFLEMTVGLNYQLSTIILVAIPLSYSLYFGLKSSVITDFIKVSILYLMGLIMIALTLYYVGEIKYIPEGINGINKNYTSLFDQNGWLIFISFGLPTTIGLLSGPFGDQAFWQRAFSMNSNFRRKSFLLAAFLFIIVPISMGILGFSAAGIGYQAKSPQFVNLELVMNTLGMFGIILFSIIVLSSVTSILDSKLCAVSSIAGHDIANKISHEKNSMIISKSSMIFLSAISLVIANIPNIQLIYLFLIYGALRASTLLPTILTMFSQNKFNEKGVFYGILTSIFIGVPVFAYGLLNKLPLIIITGSLGGVLIPGVIILIFYIIGKRYE